MQILHKPIAWLIYTAIALSSTAALAQQRSDFKLLEPQTLSVAITGDMPGMVAKDGKLVGYDGEILQIAADRIGLKIKPVPMEWSGAIAAVQTGRVDIIGGNVAWTRQRAEILALTDPTSYFQNGITSKSEDGFTRLEDLENRRVGSITGFSFLPELRRIKGLQLSLYDSSDAAIRDILSGRIDALVGDPPVINYALSLRPEWGLVNRPFANDDADYPLLTGKGRQYVFGLSKDNEGLADALSREIGKLWQSCEMRTIGKKYGDTGDASFAPGSSNLRAGVDRPIDWVPPGCSR